MIPIVNNTVTASTIAPETVKKAENQTYGQILKSSALIGGSSLLNIGTRIIRTKAMAMLLGPTGFGLLSVYSSIADFAISIAGLGVNSSGVRQIAEAVGSGEVCRIARTATVLRKTSILLGVFGSLMMAVLSHQVSILTFGTSQHAAEVVLLSLVVLFSIVSAGQGALIQGMRRISDLAKIGVLGAIWNTIITIPLVYFMGDKGIVPSIVGVAGMGIITTWWYSRKVQIRPPAMTVSAVREEAGAILKLGLAFMVSGLLMSGAAYAVRTMVLRTVGLEAAGLYQSAWALGGLYIGFILGAMGADFYPRLTAVAKDNDECNRLVNEQAHVGLLLAGPGVLATLTFAPLVLELFYSARFDGASDILRWFCLGMTLRVINWPMGFIVVAKGEQTIFILIDLCWTVVNVVLSWICLKYFGLIGTGIAFFGSYVFHGFMVYPIVRRLSGFSWSTANMKTGLFFMSLIAAVFAGVYLFPPLIAVGLGIVAVLVSTIYSTRALVSLIPLGCIPLPILKVFVKFGFIRKDTN